jgi:hypothetical protein
VNEGDLSGNSKVPLTFKTTLQDYTTNVSLVQAALIQSLATVGIPRLDIPGGNATLDTDLDVDITYNSQASLSTQSDSGFVSLGFGVSASESNGGSSSASFSDTLKLTSVTVPDSYAGDISNINVLFDTGLTLPLERSSEQVAPTPEPGSFFLLGGTLIATILGSLNRSGRHILKTKLR